MPMCVAASSPDRLRTLYMAIQDRSMTFPQFEYAMRGIVSEIVDEIETLADAVEIDTLMEPVADPLMPRRYIPC